MIKKIKIFYVDDEPALCELFKEFFESPQREIFTFTDPERALAEAERLKPIDLIFSDFRMPKLNGFDLLKSFPGSGMKVLVTGELELDFEKEAFRICQKPWKIEQIEALIQEIG